MLDMKYSKTKKNLTETKASLNSVFQNRTQVYRQLEIIFIDLGHGTPSSYLDVSLFLGAHGDVLFILLCLLDSHFSIFFLALFSFLIHFFILLCFLHAGDCLPRGFVYLVCPTFQIYFQPWCTLGI